MNHLTLYQELSLKLRERKKRKAALNDRKSAASQARMKSITNLASDEKVGRKKRKVANGKSSAGRGSNQRYLTSFIEDSFGANDEDWAVYRKIVSASDSLCRIFANRFLQNIAAPSSDEEDDLVQLSNLEQKLLQHDPAFTNADTHAAVTSRRSELMSAFRPEYEDGDVEGTPFTCLCGYRSSDSQKGHNRIHLNVERWRVPETYFHPSMAGVDSAGLGEVVEEILSAFTESEKARLAGVSGFGRGIHVS